MATWIGSWLRVLHALATAKRFVEALALSACLLSGCSYTPAARSVPPAWERRAVDPGPPAVADELVVRVERDTLTIHSVVVEAGESLSLALAAQRHSARVLRLVLVDHYDDAALVRVLLAAFDGDFRAVVLNVGLSELTLPLDQRRTADYRFVAWVNDGRLSLYDLRKGAKPRLLATVRPDDTAAENVLRDQLSTLCSCEACRAAIDVGPSTVPGSTVSVLQAWARIAGPVRTLSSSLAYVKTRGYPSSGGRLSALVVGRVFQNHVTPLMGCFQDDATRNEDLAVPLRVSFLVREDGSVSDVKPRSSSVANEAALGCVLRTIERFEFPSPGDGPARLVYPIVWGAALRK